MKKLSLIATIVIASIVVSSCDNESGSIPSIQDENVVDNQVAPDLEVSEDIAVPVADDTFDTDDSDK